MLYKLAHWAFEKLLSPELGKFGNEGRAIPLTQPPIGTTINALSASPTISIVTPSYNCADYLPQTIRSVLDQGYPNLEYIVMDGGSTDKSADIIKSFEDKLSYWQSQRDKGQADAINQGFAMCSGEIMGYLNSDDILLQGSLNYIARYFLERPDVDAVYGHRVLIDEYDREIGRWIMPPHRDSVVYWRDFIPQETLFWRRSAWLKAGAKLDEQMHFALDWDLILRFVQSGANIRRLPRFIGAFRVREGQKSTTLHDTYRQEANCIYEKYLGYVPSEAKIRTKVLSYLLVSRVMELAEKLKISKTSI